MNLWAEDLEVNALIAELEAHPHRLNEGNSYGSSPLTRACGNSRWDLARILIEMGADVNSLNRVLHNRIHPTKLKSHTHSRCTIRTSCYSYPQYYGIINTIIPSTVTFLEYFVFLLTGEWHSPAEGCPSRTSGDDRATHQPWGRR